jgi:hypothetical protein
VLYYLRFLVAEAGPPFQQTELPDSVSPHILAVVKTLHPVYRFTTVADIHEIGKERARTAVTVHVDDRMHDVQPFFANVRFGNPLVETPGYLGYSPGYMPFYITIVAAVPVTFPEIQHAVFVKTIEQAIPVIETEAVDIAVMQLFYLFNIPQYLDFPLEFF